MTYSSYCESADFLRTRLNGFTPEALLILGSGLGFLGDAVEDPIFVDYGEIPHFRPSTAPGHKGCFVFGTLRGRRVAVMQGRMHCYEGYTMAEAAYAVRVVRLLGAKTLFVTNAAGCVNTDWNVGELMLLSDHIKLFDFGPLRGPNLEEFGTRFPDMTTVYTPRLRVLAHEAAKAHNIPLRDSGLRPASGASAYMVAVYVTPGSRKSSFCTSVLAFSSVPAPRKCLSLARLATTI